ncbi:MAG: class I SAM-dependent methyltransferase, partial [Candidatus Sericytochromatia bacterium]
MSACPVCHAPLPAPLYTSVGGTSITSLCELHPEPTRLRFCGDCSHAATDALEDVEGYYDHAYKILIDSEEEDQIYEVRPDGIIYRVQHQVETLLKLVPLAEGARLLDYGCAKSATMRALHAVRPDVEPHLFDVSEMYVPFWEKFLTPDRWATYRPRPEWAGRFDVVTSFFALEHVVDLAGALAQVRGLLKPDGTFYFIVPNPYFNTADMIVIDHVNHFSRSSLVTMLARAGFTDVAIDEAAHAGTFVVRARPGETRPETLPAP